MVVPALISKAIPLIKTIFIKYAVPIGKAFLKEIAEFMLVDVVLKTSITAIEIATHNKDYEDATSGEKNMILHDAVMRELARQLEKFALRNDYELDLKSDSAKGLLSQISMLVSTYSLPFGLARNDYLFDNRLISSMPKGLSNKEPAEIKDVPLAANIWYKP